MARKDLITWLTAGVAIGFPVVESRADWRERIEPVGAAQFDDAGQAELQAIVNAIGDTRLVQIEAVDLPASGASMLAMADVLRALHATAGFDALVIGMGIFEAEYTMELLEDRVAVADAAAAWFRVFRDSREALATLDVVQDSLDSSAPIEVLGTLCQYHAVGKETYPAHLERVFASVEGAALTADLLARLESDWRAPARLRDADVQRSISLSRDLLEHFDAHAESLAAALPPERLALERQMLQSMSLFTMLEQVRGATSEGPADASVQLRELAALENLAWLVGEHLRDRKIVLWGGHDVERAGLRNTIYRIGITYFDGDIGIVGREPSATPPALQDSFERALAQLDVDSAFLNLDSLSATEREALAGLSSRFDVTEEAPFAGASGWTDRLDGVLFIRTTTPSTMNQ